MTERIALVPPGQTQDPVVQRVYGEIERELGFGVVPNVFQSMAGQPGFLEGNWHLFRAVVLRGELPRVLKEMMGVVVSTVHRSPYAQQVHLHSLSVQGIDQKALLVLSEGRTDPEGLSVATLAALRFAQRAAREPTSISDADLESLRAAGFTDAEIAEAMATVQVFTAVNTWTDLAAVPLDQL